MACKVLVSLASSYIQLQLSSLLLSHFTATSLPLFAFIYPFNHSFNIKQVFIEHPLGDKVYVRFLVFTSQCNSHSSYVVSFLPVTIVTLECCWFFVCSFLPLSQSWNLRLCLTLLYRSNIRNRTVHWVVVQNLLNDKMSQNTEINCKKREKTQQK